MAQPRICERDNPLGLRYTLVERGPNETTVRYNHKATTITVPLSIDEMSQRWYNWQMRGEFIQHAFDALTATEREFLITGITAKEWDELFKEEDK